MYKSEYWTYRKILSGYNMSWFLSENLLACGVMTSFSHQKFTESLIAQIFRICQIVNFRYYVYNYGTGIEHTKDNEYAHSSSNYFVIIILQI